MKIIFILAIFCSFTVNAGNSFGNGGDVVVCKDQSQIQKSVELLDYVEYFLMHGPQSDIPEVDDELTFVLKKIEKISKISPIRASFYRKVAERFFQEVEFVIHDLNDIPDEGTVVVPSGCEKKQIAVQDTNETDLVKFQESYETLSPILKNRYKINKVLWESLTSHSRAGLILHEIIYREVKNIIYP